MGEQLVNAIGRALWIAAIVTLTAVVVVPPGYIGLSLYAIWLRGYGFGCWSDNAVDVASPSKRWIARTQRVHCHGIGMPGSSVEVALIPNNLAPLFSRHRRVFDRAIPYDDVTPVLIVWRSDDAVEIDTVPCGPSESSCSIVPESDGIKISFNLPSQSRP